MSNKKERLMDYVEDLEDPVLGAFLISAQIKSEDSIRKVSKSKGRNYSSCTSAARNRLARRDIIQTLNAAVTEGKYSAASVSLANSQHKLRDAATQQSIRSSMALAA